MRSPALAIAWEFRHRHRWGLLALASYLLVAATVRLLILEPEQAFDLDDALGFAIVIVVPVSAAFTYVLAVFTFGLEGDLAARQSIYPARMFTLPVTSAALAGWPMLYGTTVVAVLWVAMRLLAVWPSGFPVPVLWPALAAAVLLVWTQALTWMPYGLPGMRVAAALLWLVTIDVIVILAIEFKASELAIVTFLAPQVPLAYLTAWRAVARARRGEVPDWRPMIARLFLRADVLPRRQNHFRSPERAQLWFEWRRHGRSLPLLVGSVLPFELALLFAAGDTPALVFVILLGVLVTPPFMAAVAAATVSKANPHAADSYSVTPFVGTRPVTSAALIAAKLKMTMLSTVAAWLLVIVAVPPALKWSDTWPMVAGWTSRGFEVVGTPRTVAILLLLFGGFMLSTWRQLVQSLFIGLSGRERIIKVNMFLLLSFLVAIGPIIEWALHNRHVLAVAWDAIPWILAGLVGVKMSAAAFVAVRLYQSRLLSDRGLVTGAAVWLVAVLALYGVFVWFVDTALIPRYLLMLVAILSIPLARLSAAPLALAWNRHR